MRNGAQCAVRLGLVLDDSLSISTIPDGPANRLAEALNEHGWAPTFAASAKFRRRHPNMSNKEHTPLAQELTAQVQLGLMGTA